MFGALKKLLGLHNIEPKMFVQVLRPFSGSRVPLAKRVAARRRKNKAARKARRS